MTGKYRYTASEVDAIIARNRTLDRGPVVIAMALAAISGAAVGAATVAIVWWLA